MESQVWKKARTTTEDGEEEDRISRLPDALLHKILSFLETTLAVQTSILSKRWKLVWTTLPFLKFSQNTEELARHVLTHRNHLTHISSLELTFLPRDLIEKFVKYGISRHVEYLHVALYDDPEPILLSNFNSVSIRKLKLEIVFDYNMSESDCWDLPSLTTLHLTALRYPRAKGEVLIDSIPEFCLTRLPALTTLCLSHVRLESLSLPNLTTLELYSCQLHSKVVWNFPALRCLTLDDVLISEDIMNDIFPALVGLQNLTLSFFVVQIRAYVISCPQLLNLEIKTRSQSFESINKPIVVLAPKLSNFTSVGIFSIRCLLSKLDNVNIKLRDSIDYYPRDKLKEYYQQFPCMLIGLRNAKILNLDLEAFKVLSFIFKSHVYFPSPFSNLKFVKLPHGLTETFISSTLRSFLIGRSPTATIVTTLPQSNMIPQIAAAAVTAQNVVPQKPSAAPTKVLVVFESIHKTMCIDGVDMKVQDENVAQNSALAVDKARQIDAPVERTGNDQASNSRANTDFGLWRGHEISSEFVSLLDVIMNKYPETFMHFTKYKKFSTMKLNMLCTSVINFTKISMSEVDTELIAECKDVIAGLQNFGFNVSWLVNRLNYIEMLRFSQPLAEIHEIDCRINNVKTKLQDLQTLRAEKMQEIQKAFGTLGTNLVVGCIGDDLLSGWGPGRTGHTGAANTGKSQREGLMSYKQFILELEDDILPAKADRRYQEYKSEWLKDKYHPTNLLAVIDRRNEHARMMAEVFFEELRSGTVDIGPGIDASASKAGQSADSDSENEVDASGKMKQHERGLTKETVITKAHPVSSKSRRVMVDIEQAQALVRKLDLEKGVENNILCRTSNETSRDKSHGRTSGLVVILRGSTSVKGLEGIELLDTLVTYLWRIHGVDYYGLIETNKPKGLRHVRADGKNSDATGNEDDEWEMILDSFWKKRLNGQDPLKIMTAKEKINAAAGELLDPYVQKIRDEIYGEKYGCKAKGCTKLFYAAEYVIKHLKLKHPEILLEVTPEVQEELYLQNYMCDENAPGALPVMKPTEGVNVPNK